MHKKIVLFFVLFSVMFGACSSLKLNWISYSKKGAPRSPKDVKIFFTKKIISKDYRIIARYNIDSLNSDPREGLLKIRAQAAKDGCDGILVESAFWSKMTLWSWVYLLIPISETRGVMTASGIRFISNN